MGILRLFNLLESKAPGCIKHKRLSEYSGKVIAIDASTVTIRIINYF